jgi:TRAP-type mannitol/chloroaromatic compound transport system permease small subunit
VRPVERVTRGIDFLNEHVGRLMAWTALLMVLTQFVVVVMRYVFGIGSVVMQEAIVYMHACIFLLAAGYTLRHNSHVRCDIFYADAPKRRRAWIDLIGVLVFLFPMCALIGWFAWPYVVASWQVLEVSQEGRLGIPGVYLLKTTILLFAALVTLQGLALGIRSLLTVIGLEPDDGEEEQDGA